MPVKEPRNPLEKRDLLHAEPPRADRVGAVAHKLLDENRYSEAVDYVEIAPDPELLTLLEKHAIENGSVFILKSVERIRKDPALPQSWLQLSAAAQKAERWIEAVRALEAAGSDADAEALRLEKCPEYDPFKPLGK